MPRKGSLPPGVDEDLLLASLSDLDSTLGKILTELQTMNSKLDDVVAALRGGDDD